MDEKLWDDRYRDQDQLFSGNPNGTLIVEVNGLKPGRALDVGCGEGADAIWLAQQGWQVTAIDFAQTAVDRGAAAAIAADVDDRITWLRSDLSTAPPAGSFDLVSVQYFPLAIQADHASLSGLLDAIAIGGTLLVVSHDLADMPDHAHETWDLANLYTPADISKQLGDDWAVTTHESRPRPEPGAPGTHHVNDVVLRANRLS